jgi:hypothetical protein
MKSPLFPLLFLLVSAGAQAADFPAPANAMTVIQSFDSFSWDNSAGWVELKDVKSIREVFDPEGRILIREIFHGESALIETTKYAYSEAGLRKTTMNGKNETTRYAVVEKRGTGTRETIHRADGAIIAVYDTEYTAEGLPAKSEYADSEGGIIWRIAYSYNGGKDCTEISYFNADGSPAFVSAYRFEGEDDAGNWVKRTEYVTYADVKNRPREIIRRRVEYRE